MLATAMSRRAGPLARAASRLQVPISQSMDPLLLSTGGACLHCPGLLATPSDAGLFERLVADLERCGDQLGQHRSGKHLQVWGEALKDSETFTSIVRRLLAAFGFTLVDCWVNLYRHGGDMKSWHHDNYQDRTPRPTVTIGASFGETRDLAFKHVASGEEVRIPQASGDVFAFDEVFNKVFKHSVPPSSRSSPVSNQSLRVSIILWVNEDVSVPEVHRVKNPGLREGVALDVSWQDWNVNPVGVKKNVHEVLGRAPAPGSTAGAEEKEAQNEDCAPLPLAAGKEQSYYSRQWRSAELLRSSWRQPVAPQQCGAEVRQSADADVQEVLPCRLTAAETSSQSQPRSFYSAQRARG
mmetsp:Transcript_15989/g.37693  ORF Transcript_15989/g.37693 Transcript_15989/m.37693 type:complete len:353 (-) Transcript_15989:22-1080(-)